MEGDKTKNIPNEGIPFQGVQIPDIPEPINIANKNNGMLHAINFGGKNELKECYLHKVKYDVIDWGKDKLRIEKSSHPCSKKPYKPCQRCYGSGKDEKPRQWDYSCIIDSQDVYNNIKSEYISKCNGNAFGHGPNLESKEVKQGFFKQGWQRFVSKTSDAYKVVDGKIHTCNGNELTYTSERYYEMEFKEIFAIDKIDIFTRKLYENSLADLRIELDGKEIGDDELIDTEIPQKAWSTNVPFQKLTYTRKGDIQLAKKVKISRTDGKKLVLCEIEVYAHPVGEELSEGIAHFNNGNVLLSNIGFDHVVTNVTVSDIGDVSKAKMEIMKADVTADDFASEEFNEKKSFKGEVIFKLDDESGNIGNIVELRIDDKETSFPIGTNVQIFGHSTGSGNHHHYVWAHNKDDTASYAKISFYTGTLITFSDDSIQELRIDDIPTALSYQGKCLAYSYVELDSSKLKVYRTDENGNKFDHLIYETNLQKDKAKGFAVYYNNTSNGCTLAFPSLQGVQVAVITEANVANSKYIPIPMSASDETFGQQIAFSDEGTVLMIADPDAQGITPLGSSLPGAGALHFYHAKDGTAAWERIDENIYGLNSEFNFGSHGIFVGHREETLTLEVIAKDTRSDVEKHRLTAKCHVPHSVAKSDDARDPFKLTCYCQDGFLSTNGGNKLDSVDAFCTPCSHSSYVNITHDSIMLTLPPKVDRDGTINNTGWNGDSDIKFFHHRDEVKSEVPLNDIKFSSISSVTGEITFVFAELDPSAQYSIDFKHDAIHEDAFHSCSVITSCSCSSTNEVTGIVETTGRPTNFTVYQNDAHVMFSFVDNSWCDEAYSFERFDDVNEFMSPFVGKGTSFTDDYIHTAESECGKKIESIC